MKISAMNYSNQNTKTSFGIKLDSIRTITDDAYTILGGEKSTKLMNLIDSKRVLKKIDNLLLSTGENANIVVTRSSFAQNAEGKLIKAGFNLITKPFSSKSSGKGSTFILQEDTPRCIINDFIKALKESIKDAENSEAYVKQKLFQKAEIIDEKLKSPETSGGLMRK